uniref:Uncharacterized protein n=1 Tax=Pipistrellus kuhlii TaxID=59472 RepID=A0A7J8A8G9_PIPKU|nr:hypothetical protein mPipKuh1_008927 [Pipistrellus kuhlii]
MMTRGMLTYSPLRRKVWVPIWVQSKALQGKVQKIFQPPPPKGRSLENFDPLWISMRAYLVCIEVGINTNPIGSASPPQKIPRAANTGGPGKPTGGTRSLLPQSVKAHPQLRQREEMLGARRVEASNSVLRK